MRARATFQPALGGNFATPVFVNIGVHDKRQRINGGTDEDTARTIAEASPVGFGGDTLRVAPSNNIQHQV